MRVSMAHRYVKAVHDYKSDSSDDLILKTNDLIKVTGEIDKNWLLGSCQGRSGTFPRNFVKDVTIPVLRPGERVFAAIGNFPGQEVGDLNFVKGDIVIGISPVDENWWNGCLDGRIGIFPLTHVEELAAASSNLNKSEVIAKAVAISNLAAQLDDELSLTVGDIIDVLSITEDGFAVGKCKNKVGQFPLSFVKVFSGDVSSKSPTTDADFHWCKNSHIPQSISNAQDHDRRNAALDHSSRVLTNDIEARNDQILTEGNVTENLKEGNIACYTNSNTDSVIKAGITPYARTLYPFTASHDNELSFKENEIVKLIRHVDSWTEGELDGCIGYFPTSYIDIIVDCNNSEISSESNNISTNDNSRSRNESGETYARVLYDFKSTSCNDLDLQEGDTVTVLRRVDANWVEARHDDGRIGLCPVSYIELFGCELSSISTTTSHSAIILREVESQSSINTSQSDNTTNSASAHVNRSHSHQPAVSPSKSFQKPVVKPKPVRSSEHYALEFGGSFNEESLRSLNSGCPRPMVPSRTSACDRGLSLDEMVKRQLSAASASTIGSNSQNTDVVTAPASMLPRNFVTASTRAESASPALRSAGDRLSALSLSDNESNSAAAWPASSQDFDVDWLLNREMNRSAKSNEAISQGLNNLNGAHTRIVPGVKKKPAPPRPSIPLPPSARSRSEWQKFEDEQLSKSDFEKLDGNQVIEDRHISNSSYLMQFSPMQGVPARSINQHGKDAVRSELESSTSEQKQKLRETRKKVIQELCKTERDYVKSLELCLRAFAQTDGCPATLDLDVLLGNCTDVMEVSHILLGQLKVDVEEKAFDEQIVGRCFVTQKEQILKVYALYCQNHDAIITLLKKYESQPEMMEYIDRVLNTMRQHTSVFDMSSVLIKPVQRVLKYPLLLSELYKSTEDSHPDKPHLSSAVAAMSDVASSVNEYKRRKELVMKYKQEIDKTIGDKIGRLTVRSTKKKFLRMSQWLVGAQTVDENFNREETKFRAMDAAVRSLTKDISQYLENFEDSVACEELVAVDISDYYAEQDTECEVDKYCQVYNKIVSQHFCDFKAGIESDILPPLNSLLLMFQGPHKVIRKRHDKLLDYDNVSTRVKNSTEQEQSHAEDEDLQMAKRTYEALNAQLLDDLPRLFSLSLSIVNSCLMRFTQLQRLLYHKIHDQLLHLLGLQILSASTKVSSNIVEAFNICHTAAVDELSTLSFIPQSFNPLAAEVRKVKERRSTSGAVQHDHLLDLDISNQSFSQLAALRQRYPAGRLYVVSRNYTGSASMDLTLTAGTLVGVIKEGDPMGNKNKWFIDDGESKGFIMKEYLTPQATAATAVQTAGGGEYSSGCVKDFLTGDLLGPLDTPLTPIPAGASRDSRLAPAFEQSCEKKGPNSASEKSKLEWVKLEEEENKQKRKISDAGASNHLIDDEPFEEMFCRAGFAFTGRNELELSIREGEIVKVIQKYDLDGNTEWWLVENNQGRSGYAPSSYLYRMQ